MAGGVSRPGPTRPSAWACRANADTPGDARQRARARARRASGCAAPSTCSWSATGSGRATDDPGRHARGARHRAPRSCCRSSATTSRASSKRCKAIRSRSGCSIRRCTSSSPRSRTCSSRRRNCELTQGRVVARVLARNESVGARTACCTSTNPMLGLRVCRLGHRVPRDLRDASPRDLRSGVRAAQARRRRAAATS